MTVASIGTRSCTGDAGGYRIAEIVAAAWFDAARGSGDIDVGVGALGAATLIRVDAAQGGAIADHWRL
ncbi:hypothetical protein OG921_26420 [Aldersonia sp. NBC_00410]|uniref:hypothetical protein n=1 Tax=Aldersonia sp. NBC_00410 TaxID=2975954 RepID=UPI00224E1F77|nr:hypothetical protein [Aldersonia sp. NBC_00410]MCX5046715.1 hypothetical protein [Aldersonia sp. NBC_00410]